MAQPTMLSSPSPPSEEQGTILVETERLIIRRYLVSDAAALSQAANNKNIAVNMRNTFPSPYKLSDAENFLTNIACKPEGTSYPYHNGIFLKSNTPENPSPEPVFVGSVGVIPRNDIYFRVWEMGYWLAEEAWGKGYATEAFGAFVRWCFQTWPNLNRIEASAMEHNTGSQNVLSKCGFIREGKRRGSVFKNGKLIDEIQFGLLRDDLW
ncbi:hypothetical protein HG530_004681 [Fusarium avenaceum]|nr:hypothetical protein HG530_004681 [Fusarium avenaceum]